MDLFSMRNFLAGGKTIYDLPLRVTYYARVSTDKDEQAHSLQAQINYYEEFIRQNPNWSFVSGYVDEGLSGTSVKKREAFLQMMEDARLGKFDFIITKEISRFSRSTLDSIQYTQELLRHGVGVFFQSDNINTLSSDAELRLTIMSSIAQDEVRKISERVRFGFKRSIEKGVVLGNSAIWGYQKDNGKLVLNEEQAKIVRLIFDLYANERLGVRLVCDELTKRGHFNSKGNPFSFTTVRNIIANPKYKGYYCGNKTTKMDYRFNERKEIDASEWVMYRDEESVPPIVSEELWEKANRILGERSLKHGTGESGYNNKYAYSGKIICAEHHASYYRTLYRYKSGDKEVWQCRFFSEKGLAGCTSPKVYTTELDTVLKECCQTIIQEKSAIIHKLIKIYSTIMDGSSIREDMAKVQAQITKALSMKDKLLELTIHGRLSDEEFEQRNASFNQEIDRLKIRYEELEAEEGKSKELACNVEALRGMIANELTLDKGFTNQMADTLLDRIEVYPTDDDSDLELKVFFKVLPETEVFRIKRRFGKTSDCYRQHI